MGVALDRTMDPVWRYSGPRISIRIKSPPRAVGAWVVLVWNERCVAKAACRCSVHSGRLGRAG